MAIQLNGVNQAVNLDAHGADLDSATSPFSFYIEFSTNSSNTMFIVLHGRTSVSPGEYGFWMSNGDFIARSNGSDSLEDAGYADGNLHRALFVWRSGDDSIELWIDGTLVDSSSLGSITNINDLTGIGYNPDAENLWFEGDLSNFAVWSTEVSSGDAADLTDNTINVDDVTGTLECWLPLLSDADDASGNSRDGTLVGSPTFTVSSQDIEPTVLQPLVLNSPGVQTVLAPSVLAPLVLLSPTTVLGTSPQDIEPTVLQPLVLNSPGLVASVVPTVLEPLVLLSPAITNDQEISPSVLEPLVLLSPDVTLGLQMIEPIVLQPLVLLSPLVIVGDFQPILAGEGTETDRIFQGLVAQGFTTGSISDRERNRLLSKLGKGELETGTIHDLYQEAEETPRLPWGGPVT